MPENDKSLDNGVLSRHITVGLLIKILSVVIAVSWTVVGLLFSANADVHKDLMSKVTKMDTSYLEIKTQLSQIQTDLGWIKESIMEKKK